MMLFNELRRNLFLLIDVSLLSMHAKIFDKVDDKPLINAFFQISIMIILSCGKYQNSMVHN